MKIRKYKENSLYSEIKPAKYDKRWWKIDLTFDVWHF